MANSEDWVEPIALSWLASFPGHTAGCWRQSACGRSPGRGRASTPWRWPVFLGCAEADRPVHSRTDAFRCACMRIKRRLEESPDRNQSGCQNLLSWRTYSRIASPVSVPTRKCSESAGMTMSFSSVASLSKHCLQRVPARQPRAVSAHGLERRRQGTLAIIGTAVASRRGSQPEIHLRYREFAFAWLRTDT